MQLFTEPQLTLTIWLTAIAWLITNFEVLQSLIHRFRLWVIAKTFNPFSKRPLWNKIKDNIIQALFDIIGCQYCLSFWAVLIGTGNLFLAIIAAAIMKTIDK